MKKEIVSFFESPPTPGIKNAIKDLLAKPPEKQIIKDGALTWDPKTPTVKTLSDLTLIYIRRVRNNLFHGGKTCGGEWIDPERTKFLLKNSLMILDACLAASPEDVKRAYGD